jgi:FAD binding domain
VKLLTVDVDRLPQWYRPGLICIGDAAHAMSPIGGVSINLAVQDLLPLPISSPSRYVKEASRQRLQIIIQNQIIGPALASKGERPKAPLFMKLMQWPLLRRIPGRLLAFGVRPEHIHTPAA